MKLICSTANPPYGSLLLKEVLGDRLSLEISWAKQTELDIGPVKFFHPLCDDDNICKYLARVSRATEWFDESDIFAAGAIESWLNFSAGPLVNPNSSAELSAALKVLEKQLSLSPVGAKYLVGQHYTIADFVVFGGLFESRLSQTQLNSLPNIRAFVDQVNKETKFSAVHKMVSQNASKKPSENGPASASNDAASATSKVKQSDEGKFVDLPGAEMGKVIVRFPPEASGYLHIGHAKAALLNQYYQKAFNGTLIMRFDDTNPAKENAHFEQVILEDLKMLQIKPDIWTHTSDHFDTLLKYCEQLIREGKAYADDTDPETMKQERDLRTDSKCRNNSVEQNLKAWEVMKAGSAVGQKFCVRLKANMQSNNGCMRDPTIYRCKAESHVRTGDKYKAYPTYDFACPIVDSIENITHVLRTTEYQDRDEQFFFMLDALGLRKPYIWSYARLNMMNTVMSKRKLTWFVDEGMVEGWDDPRFPTVRGVLRRGMTVEGLKQFIVAQGGSRSVVSMEWDKIWAFNKKVIDPIAPRFTAVRQSHAIMVTVVGAPVESKLVAKHPKNDDVGQKTVWYGPIVFIEKEDAELLKEDEVVTFINWGNLIITKVHRGPDGVTAVEAKLDLDNKDFKKTAKITWLADVLNAPLTPVVCIHYDHIISKPVVGKDEDFKQFINRDSKQQYQMLGDQDLSALKKGDIIQLQRKGFYICDQPYEKHSAYTSTEMPCVLIHIPDGHTKEMPTTVGKGTKKPEPVKETAKPKEAKAVTKAAANPPASPKSAAAATPQSPVVPLSPAHHRSKLLEDIAKQGDIIRNLKAEKAEKGLIEKEVALLKSLKEQFKVATGEEWKPGIVDIKPAEKMVKAETPVVAAASPAAATNKAETPEALALKAKIEAQGETVRQLKGANASKDEVDKSVKLLLSLKGDYKTLTGTDLAPPPANKGKKDKSKDDGAAKGQSTPKQAGKEKPKDSEKPTTPKTPNPPAQPKEDADAKKPDIKKQTRLGLEVKKEENFSEWYSQVIQKAELIEYYDISGCYILRPLAYAVWEKIQGYFDGEIKKLGVSNVYFPMFVSHAALEKEKSHIADFAPEVAWVTKSGQSELAEPIAIRPTSETVMYPTFAKWIQSYRDLPLKINQWCNVVRWEFKHPTPFLRTREFLWQEGHTAHSNKEDAIKEVHTILDLYESVYHDYLAVPVIKGRKTEREKFAGADFTTTVEAYVPMNGRGIQAATSHHLGQNFSKMFEIVFEDPVTMKKEFAFQNSWGLSTRSLGVFIMVHSDNNGLILPPRVAKIQVIVIPCGITANMAEVEMKDLIAACDSLTKRLCDSGIKAEADARDNYSPGWKYNHWELKGVPVRIELGPKDLKKNEFVAVRRDTGNKQSFSLPDASVHVNKMLQDIHKNLFDRAKKEMDDHKIVTESWKELVDSLDKKCIILAPFCGEMDCEDKIKKDSAKEEPSEAGGPAMGAKSLCIPFVQPKELKPGEKCVHPDCSKPARFYTLFGRSY